MEIDVDVEVVELEGRGGHSVDGVCVTCSRCGHEVKVFGTGVESVKRGCVMLREECPMGERNFYVGVAPDSRPQTIRIKRRPMQTLSPREPPARSNLVLFFDTETTGVPKDYQAPATDFANWPRLVQIAWHLSAAPDDPGVARSYIIYPGSFKIPDAAAAIHGITNDRALAEGKPIYDVLAEFATYVDAAGILAAHNMAFDKGVVGAEFLRAGIENYCDSIKKVCTMRPSAELCRIRRRFGGGYKWPKLAELHQFLFGCGFEGAHDAANDVAAGARCYWELKKRGVL